MAGPRDVTNANVIVRAASAGNLTADETISITIKGGVQKQYPLALVVLVPQTSGTDTLQVSAKATDADKKIEVTHTDKITGGTTAFPFLLILPLPFCNSEGWDVVLDVTDTGGGVNFGAIQAWLEAAEPAKLDCI